MNEAIDRWDRIETHEAILPTRQPVTGLLTNEAIAPSARTWTWRERFDRGSLRSALEAPDQETADQILDEYVRTQLTAVPLTQMWGNLPRFWLELAKANSSPRQSVWATGQPLPRRNDIERAIEICLNADLIFEIRNLCEVRQGVQGPIFYFRDSGFLRYLLKKLKEGELASMPEGIDEAEKSWRGAAIKAKHEKAENFRWEGFIIDALRTASADYAVAYYFRRNNDEIDLVLQRIDGERWGIEITYGNPNNKPADGFFRAEEDLNLSRRSVIAKDSAGPVRRGVECLDLPRALHEVQRWLS